MVRKMNDKVKENLHTEWLNLVRFWAVFYVTWTHFEYVVFAEVNEQKMNLEKLFFFPPKPTSWFLYGYTGKYAVALLCVISGFVAALTLKNGKKTSCFRYFLKRYLRIMIPVFGVSLLTLGVMKIIGIHMNLQDILQSLFLPGCTLFYGHFWCLSSFLLGNYLIYLLNNVIGKWKPKLRVLSLGGIILVGLVISYKIYSWEAAWTIAVLFGYLLYEIIINFEFTLPKVMVLPLVMLIWWLPRGEESLKIYIRDMMSSFFVLFLLFQWDFVRTKINNFCKRKGMKNALKYSYSLYVVHGFSIRFFACQMTMWIYSWVNNWCSAYIISFLLKTLFDLSLAIAVYHICEKKLYEKCCNLLRLR